MSEACLEKTTYSDSQRYREPLRQSPYIATTTEAIKNYKENWAGVWFKETVDASDPAGNFAFQRLRHTWFTPKIDPKFRLRRDDKFYAIGSCFVRGLENALKMHKVAVESAAPELASYEIVQNSDRAAVWESDLRHVRGAGAQHVIELFLRNYLE